MTPKPAAVVQGLAHRDTVQPGLQRTALAKPAYSAKRVQENFLRNISRVSRIRKYAVNQIVDIAVIVGDEPVKGGLRSSLELVNELRFVPSPRQYLCQIGHALTLS